MIQACRWVMNWEWHLLPTHTHTAEWLCVCVCAGRVDAFLYTLWWPQWVWPPCSLVLPSTDGQTEIKTTSAETEIVQQSTSGPEAQKQRFLLQNHLIQPWTTENQQLFNWDESHWIDSLLISGKFIIFFYYLIFSGQFLIDIVQCFLFSGIWKKKKKKWT